MFIGHFAVAIAGSRVEPRLRLATALLAAQLPDVLWPCFLLAGLERATIAPGDTVVTLDGACVIRGTSVTSFS